MGFSPDSYQERLRFESRIHIHQVQVCRRTVQCQDLNRWGITLSEDAQSREWALLRLEPGLGGAGTVKPAKWALALSRLNIEYRRLKMES